MTVSFVVGWPLPMLILTVFMFILTTGQIGNNPEDGECGVPQDCVVGEWSMWSSCSHTCGENGTRTRTRPKYKVEQCGGQCPYKVSDTEPCGRVCCPRDCLMDPWSDWMLCYCTDTECDDPGIRIKCIRSRTKVREASCGGYCDDITMEKACRKLCCHSDCVMEQWSRWGGCQAQCEQSGVNNRTRAVRQDAECGGKPCGPRFEETLCTGPCCPVNCQLTEWSTWSSCNTQCGLANQTRSRLIREAKCGGVECEQDLSATENRSCENYVNVDCVVSPWSAWSSCEIDNGYCGNGKKSRSRSVVTSAQCRGEFCPEFTEIGVCYGPCCVQDCVVSEWSSWGHCSTDCGRGINNRTRDVIQPPSCGGSGCPAQLLQTRDCEVLDMVDCVFTAWTEWSSCSTDCGQGDSVRTRTLVTPAYCGGQCTSLHTLENVTCESYTARQDCQMTDWKQWGPCVRNCDRGEQMRNRSIKSNPICGGKECPVSKETRTCHEKCSQLCAQGVCSCRLGYTLQEDGYGCQEFTCSNPSLEYCPPNYTYIIDCTYVYFNCLQGYKYNASCQATCSSAKWTLRGNPTQIHCTEEATWTKPDIFCSKPNKPPVKVVVDNTTLLEGLEKGHCFTYLTTIVDNEPYDRHTYTITADQTGRFYINKNRVCLMRKADFEETPQKWNVTFRSTDVDGASVENSYEFEILNKNDPPSSVELVPNTIPENSAPGTEVGCMVAKDDDPGQTVTFTLANSDGHKFALFLKGTNTCLKLVKESDPQCYTDGGVHCVLNREQKTLIFVIILATDDGSPPQSAYFDIPIYLTDSNDKPTGITINPPLILEGAQPGETLASLVTLDEDIGQTYTYTLLEDVSGLFQITGGNLTASRSFNYETEKATFYQLTIQSADNGTPAMSVESSILVKIQDVNERPYDLQLTSTGGNQHFEMNKPVLRENLDGIIGTVLVKDDDQTDTVTMTTKGDTRLQLQPTICTTVMSGAVSCTALLQVVIAFDHEIEPQVNFTLVATDKSGLDRIMNLTLAVINVNDPPSEILFDGFPKKILEIEESRNGISLAVLTAVDDDSTDTHTFTLKGSDEGRFDIVGNTLKTAPSAYLSFEKQPTHYLTITVLDSGIPPLSMDKTLVIKLIDVNEPPSSTSLSSNKVSEMATDGTLVGLLASTDPDTTAEYQTSFMYSLPSDAHGRFKVDGDKLLVRSSTHLCGTKPCVLNYEIDPVLEVKVMTLDDGSPRLHRNDTFTIFVTDANDPPSNIKLSMYAVTEDVEIGTVIGSLTASDEDAGQTITFNVLDHQDIFGVEAGTRLVTKVKLDYERKRQYSLTIVAVDDDPSPASGTATLTVSVLDINEAPQFQGPVSIPVLENSTVGSVVYSMSILDPDHGDSLQVTMVTQDTPFQISNTSCQKLNEALSFRGTPCVVNITLTSRLVVSQAPSITISLSAQDRAGLTATYNILISVQDTNDPPAAILLDGVAMLSLNVSENTVDTDLTSLTAVDPDLQQTHTFTLTEQTDQFSIIADKLRVKTSAVLDYESVSQYDLVVTVVDTGDPPLSYQTTLTIYIDDVNEPPNSISPTEFQVAENSGVDTVVGALQVTDPDDPQPDVAMFSFSLINSASGLFKITGNQLQVAKASLGCKQNGGEMCALNFELQSSYNLTVAVTDHGVPVQTAIFDVVVMVTDVNDPPRNLKLSGNKITSDGSQGSEVGTLTVVDEDKGQGHIFTMVTGDSEAISIGSSGLITKATGASLDEGRVFSVTVQATETDMDSPMQVERTFSFSVVGSLTVTMTLTSEGGPMTFVDNAPTVTENSAVGSVLGSVVAVYPVLDIQMSFNVQSEVVDTRLVAMDTESNCQNKDGHSECVSQLTLAISSLDYEVTRIVPISVMATLPDNKQYVKHFEITVLDQNEAPEDLMFSDVIMSVQENSVNEYTGQFHSVDPDLRDVHTYTLLQGEGQGSIFDLKADGSLSTRADAVIDYETTTSVKITVTTTDQGDLSFSKDFNVTIVDVNEKPTGLSLSNNQVAEMSEQGTNVGQLMVEDPDNTAGTLQGASFHLLDASAGHFEIVGDMLQVKQSDQICANEKKSKCLLDYEKQRTHHLVVRVTDDGIPPLTDVFNLTVTVQDVNDQPRDITLSNHKVLEDATVGTVVGSLSVYDEDEGQEISFNLYEKSLPFNLSGGEIIVAGDLDFEALSHYNVTIEAVDTGEPTLTVTSELSIEVIGVNENPSMMTFISHPDSSTPFQDDRPIVAENSPVLTLIGQIVVLDPDSDDTITTFTSSSDIGVYNQKCWQVSMGSRCSSDIRSTVIFDYETATSVDLQFTATDSGGKYIRKTFQLDISNQNDPPSAILVDAAVDGVVSVPENVQDVVLTSLDVKDPETDQSHSLTITEGSNFFYIVNSQLKLTSAAKLDYETMTAGLIVVVRATDSGTPPLYLDQEINVKITDVNEPPEQLLLSNNEIPEDAVAGAEIGTLIVKDPDNIIDERQTFTFVLLDDAEGRFQLSDSSLLVKSSQFDYEMTTQYEVTVEVTDDGTPPMSGQMKLMLYITDVNEAPSNLEYTGESIPENSHLGTVLGQISARDGDAGQQLTYSVVDSGLLATDGHSLVVSGTVDYEVTPVIHFQVKVTDTGSPPVSVFRNFTTTVTDVNEAPRSITLSNSRNFTIPELLPLSEPVAVVEVVDEDINENIVIRLIDTPGNYFKLFTHTACEQFVSSLESRTVTRCTANMYLRRSVDYEMATSHSILVSVEAVDKGGLTIADTLSFTIVNNNDPPTDILLDQDMVNIPEDRAGIVVGTLSTIDQDGDTDFRYQVVSGWETFALNADQLVTRVPLNYELHKQYTVGIKTIDVRDSTISFTKMFTFNVIDVNEPPSLIRLSHTEVKVDSVIGYVVGHVTVVDPDNTREDTHRQTHICVVSPTDVFSLSDSFALQVSATVPSVSRTLTISITCTDSGQPALTRTQDFNISVVDVINAPKAIRLVPATSAEGRVTVRENMKGVKVGQLRVVNLLTEVQAEGLYIFTLVEPVSTVVALNDNELVVPGPLNYEDQSRFTVQVQATGAETSNEGETISENFTIYIQDVNEAPQSVGLYEGYTISEDSVEGATVGHLFTRDSEIDQTHTYRLVAVKAGLEVQETDTELTSLFVVDVDILRIGSVSTEILNYETTKFISMMIQTTDSGEPPLSGVSTLHFQVTDVNDPPTDIILSHTEVAENSETGTVVGMLSVIDEDQDQEQQCQVLNMIQVPFTVKNRLELTVAADTLDFEAERILNVEIRCGDTLQDGTRLQFTKTFTITVTNINEAPSSIVLTTTELPEKNKVGQLVGEVKVIDMDSDKVLITLQSGEGFKLEGDSTLTANVVFDYELAVYHDIVIIATDQDGATLTKNFVIQILDINEAPTSVSLATLVVKETARPGDVIDELFTLDPDRQQQFTYTLTEEDVTAGHFAIQGSTLTVGPKGFDFETSPTHKLNITSTDSGVPAKSIQSQFIIEVKDMNEAPLDIITGLVPALPEDADHLTVVTPLLVDDPDQGQSHSCHVLDRSGPLTVVSQADGQLALILTGTLDYEMTRRILVDIVCTDGEFQVQKILSVNVSDVNDPPTAIKLSGSHTVVATATAGYVIGQLSADDKDTGQKHTFTVTGPNSDVFQVQDTNKLTMLTSIPKTVFDKPDPSLRLTVMVTDNGKPTLTFTQNFTLPITSIEVVVEQLPAITIDNQEISDQSPAGTVIGKIHSPDAIFGASVRFLIVEDLNGLFSLQNNSYLVLARDLTSIDDPSVQVKIEVKDTQTQESATKTISVFIIRSSFCSDGKCSINSKCVGVNETFSSCKCNTDYFGDGKTCKIIDDCKIADDSFGGSGNSCKNGGVCKDDINSYVCVCADGFSGPRCEIEKDLVSPCENSPCQHEGFCVLLPNSDPPAMNCSCSRGWTGSLCENSVDDCKNAVCYDGGTCVDKHLSFLCNCNPERKGLQCEFDETICLETKCNSTHVCVGLTRKQSSVCVSEYIYTVILSVKGQKYSDKNTLQARLIDFISNHGRLPRRPTIVTRKRRQSDSAYEIGDVYVVSTTEVGEEIQYKLVILDEEENPVPATDVLKTLSTTCNDIATGGQSETVFCPAILAAVPVPTTKPPNSPGSSAGIIAGVIVALLLVSALVALGIVIAKKKKDNSVSPEDAQERTTGSRRPSFLRESNTAPVAMVFPSSQGRQPLCSTSQPETLTTPPEGYKTETLTEHSEHLTEHFEHVSEQSRNISTPLENSTELSRSFHEQLADSSDQPKGSYENLKDSAERMSGSNERMSGSTEQLRVSTEQQSDFTEQLRDSNEQPEISSEQLKDSSEHLEGRDEQLTDSTEQLRSITENPGNNDEPLRSSTKQSTHTTDLLRGSTEQLISSSEQQRVSSEQVRGSTERIRSSTEQLRGPTEHLGGPTEQLKGTAKRFTDKQRGSTIVQVSGPIKPPTSESSLATLYAGQSVPRLSRNKVAPALGISSSVSGQLVEDGPTTVDI